MNKLLYKLLLLSAFSTLTYYLHIFIDGHNRMWYLNWNLILAWLPLIFALQFVRNKDKSKLISYGYLALWLVFLPNSPYVSTDFIHLKLVNNTVLYYEIFMIFMFAFTSLTLGNYSIYLIQKSFKLNFLKIIPIFIIGSYGIYLGRIPQLNSWDVVVNPSSIVYNALSSFSKEQIEYTLLLTSLFSIYWSASFLLESKFFKKWG